MLRSDLGAGWMPAATGDFHFFAAGVFAEVAAEFLAGLDVAIARFVGALMLLIHVRLLPP
jgi:hypothetical protein